MCDGVLQKWAADITAGKDVIALLPVFDRVRNRGQRQVQLTSFAAFKVKGWKFSGMTTSCRNPSTTSPPCPVPSTCTNNCRGIIGSFIEYVSLADGYTSATTEDSGADIVASFNSS